MERGAWTTSPLQFLPHHHFPKHSQHWPACPSCLPCPCLDWTRFELEKEKQPTTTAQHTHAFAYLRLFGGDRMDFATAPPQPPLTAGSTPRYLFPPSPSCRPPLCHSFRWAAVPATTPSPVVAAAVPCCWAHQWQSTSPPHQPTSSNSPPPPAVYLYARVH